MSALPTGVPAPGFAEEINRRDRKNAGLRPHCGGDISGDFERKGIISERSFSYA